MDRPPIETVLLAIATRGRPVLLGECLRSLEHVQVPPGVAFEVLVVDNNPGGDALPVVEVASERAQLTLSYVHVPETGIVMARNRAIEEALARGVDALAYVDDDNVLDASWLEESLRVVDELGGDVVIGPSRKLFPEGTPAWFPRIFPSWNRPTGILPQEGYANVATTCNVLFRSHLVGEWGLRFLEEFNLGGGEDTTFFCMARDHGAVTVWAEGAGVTETVPPSRVNLRWFLQRRFRIGNSMAFMEDRLGYRRFRWYVILHNFGHILEKALLRPALAVLTLDFSVERWTEIAEDLAKWTGVLVASLGYRYLEYREVHGH
jgi:succinoglycan biosynthesis protein ExoM